METGEFVAKQFFCDFKIVDADSTSFYVRKEGVGVVAGSVDASHPSPFIVGSLKVEKYGQRTKLFSGKRAIERALKFLTA